MGSHIIVATGPGGRTRLLWLSVERRAGKLLRGAGHRGVDERPLKLGMPAYGPVGQTSIPTGGGELRDVRHSHCRRGSCGMAEDRGAPVEAFLMTLRNILRDSDGFVATEGAAGGDRRGWPRAVAEVTGRDVGWGQKICHPSSHGGRPHLENRLYCWWRSEFHKGADCPSVCI